MGAVAGKVVIVTGAGRGIGRAVARLFAREGARVLVNDLGCEPDGRGEDPSVARAVVDEIRAEGGDATASVVSATTAEGAERVVRAAMEAYGQLDALVYAAGLTADHPLARLDEATWSDVVHAHLRGATFATRAAALVMQRQQAGRIVLTTGSAGLLGTFGQPAYSAAAAGVYGLMRAASIELQRRGIFVNAVAPLAKTRLTEALPMFEHVESMTPEHVAPGYLFLGSDLAGDLSGNVLSIAGGRISLFRVTESQGRFKETGPWTAEEIGSEWAAMARP